MLQYPRKILNGMKSFNIIQKKDYRSDLIPTALIPAYKKRLEQEKQYLKEISERFE